MLVCKFFFPALGVLIALSPAEGRVWLVRDGKPVATIVIAEKGTESARFSAEEFARCIERLTGARLKIMTDSNPPEPPRVLIGASRVTERLRVSLEGLPPWGFVISTLGGNFVLAGIDGKGNPKRVETPTGTLLAVYHYLREELGFRWIWPGELGEVLPPKKKNIAVDGIDIRWIPAMKYCYLGGGFGSFSEMHLWQKKNGIGRKDTSIRTGHAFEWVITKENYQNNPDIFAMRNGKRVFGQQPCYNSPAFIALVAPWARKQLLSERVTAVSLMPNDGSGFCDETCPYCSLYIQKDPKERHGLFRTDAIIAGLNKVIEAAGELPPGKYFTLRTYSVYRSPPRRIKPHRRLMIIRWEGKSWTRLPTEKDKKFVSAWTGEGKNPLLIDGHWWCVEDSPTVATRSAAERIKFWQKNNLLGFRCEAHSNWSAFSPMYYLVARLLYDPRLTREEVLDEFYSAFGGAVSAIRSLHKQCEKLFYETQSKYDIWSRQGKKPENRPPSYSRALLEAKFFEKCLKKLDLARKSARTDVERARVEYISAGFELVELLRERQEKEIELLGKAGWLAHHRLTYYSSKPEFCALQMPPYGEFRQRLRQAWVTAEQVIKLLKDKGCDRSGVGPLPPYRTDDQAYLPRAITTQRYPELQLKHLLAVLERRELITAPSKWKFRYAKKDEGQKWYEPDLDDSDWREVSVCVPTKYQGLPPMGHSWYRLRFKLPNGVKGKRISILFGGLCMSFRIYINGRMIKERIACNLPYANNPMRLAWRVPFEVEVTEYVRPGKNLIAVHCWNDEFSVLGFWRPAFVLVGTDAIPAPEQRPAEVVKPKRVGDL